MIAGFYISQTTVLPGGKLQERRASRFSFFQHINNETNKTAGGCFWGAGFSLPLGEPHSFRVSLSGMGLLFRETIII